MEDILYVKAEQNVAVKKKDLQIKDVATLYSYGAETGKGAVLYAPWRQ